MIPLPLNIQTLIADLAQSVNDDVRAVSVHTKTVADGKYLYAREKIGRRFRDRSLGPSDSPDAQEAADQIRSAGKRARARRKLVTLIKRSGVPAPSTEMSRLIEAISGSGLFARGMVLVGTGAYQVYPSVVGAILASSSLQTQDGDLAVARVAIESDLSLLEILQQADPTFRPVPGLDAGAPAKKFVADSGFAVEVLTPVRSRSDGDLTLVPGLAAAAIPLKFLHYLVQEAIPAIALIGSGVPVTVPQPARFAVHKLIVAQRRPVGSLKRQKDLLQAAELVAALARADPHAIEDALEDARDRGPSWRRLVDDGLHALEQQG